MSTVKIEVGELKEKPPLRKITYGKSVDVEDEHALFKSLDTDNNGFIPLKDLTEAILISTELFGLTSSQAEELVRDVDVNKDNKIDFPEFCTLMARAKKMQMRRIVLYAAQSVLGRTQQAEAFRYITPYHNCSPPPVFMIIVSIVQIAIYSYFNYAIYDLDQVAIPESQVTSETTFMPDYSTALVDYSDFNSTSNLTTLSPVYEDLITNTSVFDNSTTEVANLTEMTALIERIHIMCDYNINRDVIATNSLTKCVIFYKMEASPVYKWELWRAFTSIFLHNDLAHLIGNLSIQLLLGIPLELVHKVQRIAPIYFLGALLGRPAGTAHTRSYGVDKKPDFFDFYKKSTQKLEAFYSTVDKFDPYLMCTNNGLIQVI
uniref:EF-hand domain-containing protein n=1 Tax=Acrobeloides nanus TaxID=290746 RepID=A0A914C0V2_9BILA